MKKKTGNTYGRKLRLVRKNEYPVAEPKRRENVQKKYRRHGSASRWIVLSLVLLVIACLLGLYLYIESHYTVTTVYVEGNVHYTNEEIMDMVMGGHFGNNSLFLSLKYRGKEIEGVPFVQTMDVEILSPDTIRINVYEKALAGYVEYLGKYMYFDKDGIIVESSDAKTTGIPQVTGLQFGYVLLHEKLPVENEAVFNKILNITQLLTKYGVPADKIYFDEDYDMTLYFEKVRVKVGNDEKINEKIMKLQSILPSLAGKSGTLEMENYTEESKNITFALDE